MPLNLSPMTRSELDSISAPSSLSFAEPHAGTKLAAAANVVNAANDVRFTGHLHECGYGAIAPLLWWIFKDKLDPPRCGDRAARSSPQQRSDQLRDRERVRCFPTDPNVSTSQMVSSCLAGDPIVSFDRLSAATIEARPSSRNAWSTGLLDAMFRRKDPSKPMSRRQK